jgi:hypothetical protein
MIILVLYLYLYVLLLLKIRTTHDPIPTIISYYLLHREVPQFRRVLISALTFHRDQHDLMLSLSLALLDLIKTKQPITSSLT